MPNPGGDLSGAPMPNKIGRRSAMRLNIQPTYSPITAVRKSVSIDESSQQCSWCVPFIVLEHLPVLRLADSPLKLELPLFSAQVPAGFPSPADDHIEGKLDLNEHLCAGQRLRSSYVHPENPCAASGSSMAIC